jgi:hypothetical protein
VRGGGGGGGVLAESFLNSFEKLSKKMSCRGRGPKVFLKNTSNNFIFVVVQHIAVGCVSST